MNREPQRPAVDSRDYFAQRKNTTVTIRDLVAEMRGALGLERPTGTPVERRRKGVPQSSALRAGTPK